LFGTTYTNKMHLLFGSPFHKNSTFKRAWHETILGQVTFWEVTQKAREWGQNTLKKLVLVCGGSVGNPDVWDYMVEGRLINFCWYYLYEQDAFFSVAHSIRTTQLSMFDLEQFWDGWPSMKFLEKCASEERTSWKDSCWFVGLVDNPESRIGCYK